MAMQHRKPSTPLSRNPSGEVVQAACKILRHGYESTNPNEVVDDDHLPETNRGALERELGDLAHAQKRMEEAHDLSPHAIDQRRMSKPERIEPYLHHQFRREEGSD